MIPGRRPADPTSRVHTPRVRPGAHQHPHQVIALPDGTLDVRLPQPADQKDAAHV